MDPDGDGSFHRKEAISAVQDVDQYYGDDDDYDDLYNDVNVGDGFLHASQPPPPPPQPPALPPKQHQPPPQQPQPPQQQQQVLPSPSLPLPPPPPMGQPDKVHIPSAPAMDRPNPGHLPPPPQPPLSTGPPPPHHHQIQTGGDGFHRQGGANNYGGGPIVVGNGGGGDGPGATTLFVGDLHWWTTDADLEAELVKYGHVKEVRFFDEKASGKSKGYCQVDFFDPGAAAACKEGMNGHLFNGRPCVVAFASPNTVRRMGEAQMKNHQPMGQQNSAIQKGGRGGGPPGGGPVGPQVGGNYGGGGRGGGGAGGGGGGGAGGGNWGGRGGGMGGRGPGGNMRNRMGPVGGGRGIMGNGGMVAPPPPMMHPGGMMGQGFDPTGYGAAMGRMGGGFGGFPGGPGGSPFPGLMQPFPPVVAPHVNPAFFVRGGGMGAGGVGMWPDPSMGGWGGGGEEQSSYGDDAASDQHYGEGGSHGKERPSEREWSGAPERRPSPTLLSLLLLLAMSTVRGGTAAAGGSPSWCVCRPDASDEALQNTLDYACGNGADCAPLHAGAECHSPDTLVSHCSYAANSYFHRIRQANEDATCDFDGAAVLSMIYPSSETCTYPASTTDGGTAASPPAASGAASWCVCKPGLSDAALQGTLDYACGHGADCDALRPGGECHDPDTLLAHCSYAANSYYFQYNKDAACDFADTAALSSTDPSSGTCKYPATDTAMSPAVGKMPLWFFGIALTGLVLYIVALCCAEGPSGSSRRATVSGGARVREETRYGQSCRPATVSGGACVEEETGTPAPAAESPVMSTCGVCLEAWTNEGPHRISCIPCGHVYGRSCLEQWLMQRGNSRALCPNCKRSYQLRDIINLYGPVNQRNSNNVEESFAELCGDNFCYSKLASCSSEAKEATQPKG